MNHPSIWFWWVQFKLSMYIMVKVQKSCSLSLTERRRGKALPEAKWRRERLREAIRDFSVTCWTWLDGRVFFFKQGFNNFWPIFRTLSMRSQDFEFYVDGVTLTTVSFFGLVGTLMSIRVLLRPHLRNSFSNLLIGLAACDASFLSCAILIIGLPKAWPW